MNHFMFATSSAIDFFKQQQRNAQSMTGSRLQAVRSKGISVSSRLFAPSVTRDEGFSITAAEHTSDLHSFPEYFGKFLSRAQILLDDNARK